MKKKKNFSMESFLQFSFILKCVFVKEFSSATKAFLKARREKIDGGKGNALLNGFVSIFCRKQLKII